MRFVKCRDLICTKFPQPKDILRLRSLMGLQNRAAQFSPFEPLRRHDSELES